MQTSDLISQPTELGPLSTKNRMVMPPLVIWKSDESGRVTDEHVAHYSRSGGAGLMIVEATTIAPEGRLAATQLGIWSDDQTAGLARLAATIHESGALAGIQIHHAGGNTNLTKTYGAAPSVPSVIGKSPEGAVEMTDEQIEETIGAYRCATRRALQAGFDVVELHGAHGYLISQFLSPATNRRSDRWGGTPEKRRAFMNAVIRAARQEIDTTAGAARGDGAAQDRARSARAALTVRLGVAASGSRALPLREGLAAAEAAVDAGVDFLDVSNAGGIDDELASRIRSEAATAATVPEGATPTLLLAALVKRRVAVPVIGVNGIRRPDEAAAAISGGIADLIAVGRATLADPSWARKAVGDDDRSIEICRQCTPRCYWFTDPPKCPARARLASRGEQPPVT
jgi:2,4-dienoyl-CoA reductase-like NADH-dependent reductase (Old Yellow Enzyme family)